MNSGHTVKTAFVTRCNSETNEPERFSTWCPKAIALIGELPSTLDDRAIVISLKRKTRDEKVKRLGLDFDDQCLDLRRKCLRWATDNMDRLKAANPQLPFLDNDRALDNWSPLIAIADLAGGEWPDKARNAMSKIEAGREDDSAKVMLLQDIWSVFSREGCERLWSQDLIKALVEMEDRPWREWKKSKPITSVGLAKLLKPFGITSIQIRQDDKNKRGYAFEQFRDALDRYVFQPATPSQNATTLQPFNHAGFGENQNATNNERVAFEKRSKPAPVAKCSVVALQKGGEGVEDIPEPEQEVIDLW